MTPKKKINQNQVAAEQAAGKQVYEAVRTPAAGNGITLGRAGGTEYYAEESPNAIIDPNDEARALADTLHEPHRNVKPI